MSGLFPDPLSGGVAPGDGVPQSYLPVNIPQPDGCGPFYFADDCSTLLSVSTMNSIMSEMLAFVDKLGGVWSCESVTNMADIVISKFQSLDLTYLRLDGGTMTGTLTLSGAPIGDMDAANKAYVDAAAAAAADVATQCCQNTLDVLQPQIDLKVNRAGDVMEGVLVLAQAPTAPMEAVTKAYVDERVAQTGNIPDAPSDGNIYGRQNFGWTVVGSAVGEVPNDAIMYVRQFNHWRDLHSYVNPLVQRVYRFETDITAPPLAGEIRLNGTQAAATVMYISETDLSGFAGIQDLFLARLRVGMLIGINDQQIGDNWHIFRIRGTPIDQGGYWEVPVTRIQTSGAGLADASRINFSILSPQGDTVASGPADLSFGFRTAVNRFVWNDKADLTGVDLMTLDETGNLHLPAIGSVFGRGAAGVTTGLNMWARTPSETPQGGCVSLRGATHGVNPNGVDFLTGSDTTHKVTASLTSGGAMGLTEGGSLSGAGGTLGLGLYARALFTADQSSHIGLRGPGHVASPNGIDFYTGGTGTASFSQAMQLLADKRALFKGQIEAVGNVVTDQGFISLGGVVASRSATNPLMTFQNGSAITTGLISQNQTNGVVQIENRFTTTGNVLQLGTTGNINLVGTVGNLTISGAVATKATGTTWANPSDQRIKNVVGDYEIGLDEITQLQPRRFKYKGNNTPDVPGYGLGTRDPDSGEEEPEIPGDLQAPYRDSPHYRLAVAGTEVVGFVAQEVEAVMPAMVQKTEAYIDGEKVDDFLVLDTNDLTFALVNAIKELSAKLDQANARIAALEQA